MPGETQRGVEFSHLTDADKAEIENGLQQVVELKNKKKPQFAEGTNPGLARVKEDFSDIENQLNNSELVATKGAFSATESALQMVRETAKTDVQNELEEVRSLIETHNDPAVVAQRKEVAGKEAGEIGDRIFAKVEQDIATDNKVRKEMQPLKALRAATDQAVAAYAKAYAEYDPNFVAKFYAGKESVEDKLAAYDLTSVTKPPLTAVLSSKGRKLRTAYQQMMGAVKNFNSVMEKNK